MRNVGPWIFGALTLLAQLPGQAAYAEDGITKDSILVGRSAGITGALVARSKPATEAVNAYIDEVNQAGGVNGRRLKLTTLDDGFDPKRAAENTRKLVAEDKVFTMFLSGGGPATLASLPVLTSFQVPLVGSTSGSDTLRKPSRLVFHLKASYSQEFTKIAEFIKGTGVQRVAVVYSDDTAGREGEQLSTAALKKIGIQAVADIGFKPGEVKLAVNQLLKSDAQAVILAAVAGPGAEFFREFTKLDNRPQVFAWSATGVEAIYKEVGDKARGMVVAQISASPADRSVLLVRDYHAMLKKANLQDGGYPGLEGYIGARVLVEALKRSGKEPTRDKLIAALETMHDYDLGDDVVNFGADHVGRRFVELTVVGRDGRMMR